MNEEEEDDEAMDCFNEKKKKRDAFFNIVKARKEKVHT